MPNLDHGTVILARIHKREIYLSFYFPCLGLKGLHCHLQPYCQIFLLCIVLSWAVRITVRISPLPVTSWCSAGLVLSKMSPQQLWMCSTACVYGIATLIVKLQKARKAPELLSCISFPTLSGQNS